MRELGFSLNGLESVWKFHLADETSRSPSAMRAREVHLAEDSLHAPGASVRDATACRVLVAQHFERPRIEFQSVLDSVCADDRQRYRIEAVVIADLDELDQLCHSQPPRVLLVEIELARAAGPDAIRHLRRRLPSTDWLLACDTPMIAEVGAAILDQMRGCINWTAGADQLVRAFDSVLLGRLWFSRAVLESLYLARVEAGDHPSHAIPAGGGAGAMTGREAEVFALMRRGLTNRQIAERLGISVNTVKKHLTHVFEKRGLHGRRQELA